MGFQESVRGMRGQGSAGALWAAVGVLLLRLSLAQTGPPQTACPAAIRNITQPQYELTAEKDASVGFMAALVQSFLHTIQPNPFPQDLIVKIVKDFKTQINQELIKEALVYEVGFLVCAAIGVLYIVLMPIVGLVLACCRYCGNCGGKMYQKQTPSIHCHRRALYWTAFVTTVILLAGNICMFKSNEAIKVSVDKSPVELNKTINNIQAYLTVVPQQIEDVVSESYKIILKVSNNLEAIGLQMGKKIKAQLQAPLYLVLDTVKLLDQEIRNTSLRLVHLNSSLAQLQPSMDNLQANLTAVKIKINNTVSNPNCIGCNNLKPLLHNLMLDTSITAPGLYELGSAVEEIDKIDLKSKLTGVEYFFNNIPQTLTNATKGLVQSSKQELGNIKTQISKVTKKIPLNAVANVSKTLNLFNRNINKIIPDVKRFEHIRWAVCVVLCCVVLLVVVCNFLGLVLGPLGLKPNADPTKRSCSADCGGTFFMIGAGVSFLFSWLFMIAVLLLFLMGGNVYTLLCRPWIDGQLFKLIDTPGVVPGLDIGSTLGLKTKINISDIYRDCEKNQPLWTTLHLYELMDLDDLLNVTQYTQEIQQIFQDANITLSKIILLSPEFKNQLRSFSNEVLHIDFTTVIQQINNISSINLNTIADELDQVAARQPKNDTREELQNEARDLRQIQSNTETIIIPQLGNLKSNIRSLGAATAKISGTAKEVLSNVGAAQDFLNTNTTQIVKTESKLFLDCQLGYFISYADWANITIIQQVGRCGPVAGAVDSAHIVLCSYIVESLNAFWFSLGWCMIFFIPSIIFSITLAKYYKKMKFSDVYDDKLIMNHIPRAQMKIN